MWKKISILIAATALIVVGGRYALNAWHAAMLDTKSVRTGRGIVERKEHIIFDHTNNRYLGQAGQVIEREPGSEEYRLYYRVIAFGAYNERKRAVLENTERRRITENNLRFTIVTKELYDSTQQGDEIRFSNQFIYRDDVMTWGAESLKHQKQAP